MTDTTLGRRREEIYGVGRSGAAYHAFFSGEELQVQAALYDQNGVWVEDRGVLTPIEASGGFQKGMQFLIHHDSGGLVGDGALAFWDQGYFPTATPPSLNVCDVEAGSFHRQEVVEAGYGIGAGYAGGFLWWIEHTDFDEDLVVTFRLRRCLCDLSGVETVTEVSFDFSSGGPWGNWAALTFRWFAMTPDAALAGFWSSHSGSAAEATVRFPLNGDAGAVDTRSRPGHLPLSVGLATRVGHPSFLAGGPIAFGGSALSPATFSTLSGYSVANSASSAVAPLWPTGTGWVRPIGNEAVTSVHPSGAEAALYFYGNSSLDDQLLIRNSLDGPFPTLPTKSIVPARHPHLDELWVTKPFAMFIRG